MSPEKAAEVHARKLDQAKKRKQVYYVANIIAVAVSLVGLATAFFGAQNGERGSAIFGTRVVVVDEQTADEIDRMRRTITAMQVAQRELLSKSADSQTRIVSKRLDAIEARQLRIERALMGDPAKAIEVPLMRRDIEALKETTGQNVAAIKQSVDQVYDLTKWLLGALAIGVLSLAISNLFSKRT